MNLTKHEIRQLKMALVSAIQWEDSLADAYKVAFNKQDILAPKVAPPEHRPIIARCERRIANYKRLVAKLANPPSTTTRQR